MSVIVTNVMVSLFFNSCSSARCEKHYLICDLLTIWTHDLLLLVSCMMIEFISSIWSIILLNLCQTSDKVSTILYIHHELKLKCWINVFSVYAHPRICWESWLDPVVLPLLVKEQLWKWTSLWSDSCCALPQYLRSHDSSLHYIWGRYCTYIIYIYPSSFDKKLKPSYCPV